MSLFFIWAMTLASAAVPTANSVIPGIQSSDFGWFCPPGRAAQVQTPGAQPREEEGACIAQPLGSDGRFEARIFHEHLDAVDRDAVAPEVFRRAEADARLRMSKLGVQADQIGSVESHAIQVVGADEPGVVRTVGVVVWVERQHRALPVTGHRAIFEYDFRGELREARGLWPALTVSRAADRRPATGDCSEAGFEPWAEREFGDIRSARGTHFAAWIPRADATNGPVEIEWADHLVVEPPSGRPTVVRCGTPRAEVMGGEQ